MTAPWGERNVTARTAYAVETARAWWLVECESAEAARHLIAWRLASHGLVDSELASGGVA